MANLGEVTEIVNAAELTLEVGVNKSASVGLLDAICTQKFQMSKRTHPYQICPCAYAMHGHDA